MNDCALETDREPRIGARPTQVYKQVSVSAHKRKQYVIDKCIPCHRESTWETGDLHIVSAEGHVEQVIQ